MIQTTKKYLENEAHTKETLNSKNQDTELNQESPTLNQYEQKHELLKTLFHELFQTEQSAALHPIREANRLGDVPPAKALRVLAAHANKVLEQLPTLARRNHLPVSKIGQNVGQMFSDIRRWIADRLIEPERSYRGTLLGIRHGVDLVELIRQVAHAHGNTELEHWCMNWTRERLPLVEAVANELAWFAHMPTEARSWKSLMKSTQIAKPTHT